MSTFSGDQVTVIPECDGGRQTFYYPSQHLCRCRNARKQRFATTSETKSTELGSERKLPVARLNLLATTTAMPTTSVSEARPPKGLHSGGFDITCVTVDIFHEDGVCCICAGQSAGMRWRTQTLLCKGVAALHDSMGKLRTCGCASRRYNHAD